MHQSAVPKSIPGRLLSLHESRPFREIISHLFNTRNIDRFPGAQPISLASRHLETLQQQDFFVTEKTDGVRVLLFTTYSTRSQKVSTYLIDRKNSYYEIDGMWFPVFEPHKGVRPQINTVLDGELVIDTVKGEKKLRFYAFDCVVFDGKPLLDRPFHKRYGYLENLIMEPYFKLILKDQNYTAGHPFKLCKKMMEKASYVGNLFERMKRLSHKSDGIIYTATESIYDIGTCQNMLKWKPSEENSVDFKVKVMNSTSDSPIYELYLGLSKTEDKYHGNLTLDDEMKEEWRKKPPHYKIIECSYDPEWEGKWKFMRFRDDKTEPNHISTFERVMESIKDNVTRDEILANSDKVRLAWKEREQQQERPAKRQKTQDE